MNKKCATAGKKTAARAARPGRSWKREWRVLRRGLYANLRRGVRTAFFRSVEPAAWAVSPGQLAAVVAAALLLGIALERTYYGAAAVFDWYSLRARWFDLPVFLLAGWLAARLAPRPLRPLTVPIALFAAAFAIGVAVSLLAHAGMQLPPARGRTVWIAAYYGGYLWFLVAAAVLLRRAVRLAYRYLPVALAPLIVLSVYDVVYPPRPAWHVPPPERQTVAPGESPVSEEMLYLQPRLAREAVEAIAPHREGVADLYFVGFAPYAWEDVFMKESEVIRDLMDARFDTRGRSLLLVNNNKTLRKYPLATVTNLRAALNAIGRGIDPQEDVVMLYLTSHGAKDHRLSARYWPLQLEEIDPALLQTMLDEAGIGFRVVIVSACYSGGYVEPLRGPKTLVMTAAAADRTSFGCDARSDFTYFAKALFDEQLRETRSFAEAFERALPAIRRRERAQGVEFSEPQIAMGEAIRERLGAIERRLEVRTEH